MHIDVFNFEFTMYLNLSKDNTVTISFDGFIHFLVKPKASILFILYSVDLQICQNGLAEPVNSVYHSLSHWLVSEEP